MKYLSFDIEATGLAENDLMIEYAMVPFDVKTKTIEHQLSFHTYIKCPSFDELRPRLDSWVIENNQKLIEKAHSTGVELSQFKSQFTTYLESDEVLNYFKDTPLGDKNKIILFGKSLNAIDLPFLNRDLGWDFMRKYFHHQVLDLSSIIMGMIDTRQLPERCLSGSELMNYLNMGEVAHTALEDAINTAKIYLELVSKS